MDLAQALAEIDRLRKRLADRNQEMDDLGYVISHDLNEPIRKMVSFSELLKQDLGEDLDERVSKDLQFIVDAAQRMGHLVQDLSALSQVSRKSLTLEQVSLAECCQLAERVLRRTIEENDAEIVHDDLPTVPGDRSMLTDLYQQLIDNSLKFTSEEPTRIHVTTVDRGESWLLGIRDNGIGLKPEHADQVFRPFQRLHRRGQYTGNGIGLSICKKTVDRHGGQLWVESELGHGAHFQFTLPKVHGE